MLPKTRKLQCNKDIQRVLHTGSFYSSQNMTLYVLQNSDLVRNTFVVLVGKKYNKSAAKRNTIRRRIYTILKNIIISHVQEKGYRFVILFRSKEYINFQVLQQEIQTLFLNSKTLK